MRIWQKQKFLESRDGSLKTKISMARTEVAFQIKMAFRLIGKEKLLPTHLKELKYLIKQIPISLEEFKHFIEAYIIHRDYYDKLKEENEANRATISPRKYGAMSPDSKARFDVMDPDSSKVNRKIQLLTRSEVLHDDA